MKVTKEQVEKAKEDVVKAEAADDAAEVVYADWDWDAFDKAVAAWDKYVKLKEEFDNEKV